MRLFAWEGYFFALRSYRAGIWLDRIANPFRVSYLRRREAMFSPSVSPALRTTMRLLLLGVALGLVESFGIPVASTPAWAQAPTPAQSASREDEKAIREADEGFVRDYNKGDIKALTAR